MCTKMSCSGPNCSMSFLDMLCFTYIPSASVFILTPVSVFVFSSGVWQGRCEAGMKLARGVQCCKQLCLDVHILFRPGAAVAAVAPICLQTMHQGGAAPPGPTLLTKISPLVSFTYTQMQKYANM